LTSTAPGLAWPEKELIDEPWRCREKPMQKEHVFKRVPLDTPVHAEVSLQIQQPAPEEHEMSHGDRMAEEGRAPTAPMQETSPAQEAQLNSEEEGSPAQPQGSPEQQQQQRQRQQHQQSLDKRRHDDWISHRSQSVPCSRRNAATEEAHAVAKIASFKETRAMWGQRATSGGQVGDCERRGKLGQIQQSAQEAEVALQRLLVCNDHDELRRMRRLINESFSKEGDD